MAAGGYRFDWHLAPAAVKAGEPLQISYVVKDGNGEVVKDFEQVHDKITHLVVVSNDLAFFNHLHPELQDGEFSIRTTVPTAGAYKLFADVTPKGGTQQIVSHEFRTVGEAPTPTPLRLDEQWAKTFEGVVITLKPNLQPLRADKEVLLTFALRDAQTGKPITDLDPYLGAFGHTVIISQDTQRFLHTHPTEGEMKSMDATDDKRRGHPEKSGHAEKTAHLEGGISGKGGPDITFATTFPVAGLYKIWGQFNYHGKIITADYVVNVQ
ncbi:MAG: hypothetical protein HY231_16885 [Acidobacteria bacterium]|nr:hypothetical protein [Acidobacteriota bacterium]